MLHPQAQALMKLMEERGVPPTHTLSPADARTCIVLVPRGASLLPAVVFTS